MGTLFFTFQVQHPEKQRRTSRDNSAEVDFGVPDLRDLKTSTRVVEAARLTRYLESVVSRPRKKRAIFVRDTGRGARGGGTPALPEEGFGLSKP